MPQVTRARGRGGQSVGQSFNPSVGQAVWQSLRSSVTALLTHFPTHASLTSFLRNELNKSPRAAAAADTISLPLATCHLRRSPDWHLTSYLSVAGACGKCARRLTPRWTLELWHTHCSSFTVFALSPACPILIEFLRCDCLQHAACGCGSFKRI